MSGPTREADKVKHLIPMGRIGTPGDVTNMGLLLSSFCADHNMTKRAIHIDGGRVMH